MIKFFIFYWYDEGLLYQWMCINNVFDFFWLNVFVVVKEQVVQLFGDGQFVVVQFVVIVCGKLVFVINQWDQFVIMLVIFCYIGGVQLDFIIDDFDFFVRKWCVNII